MVLAISVHNGSWNDYLPEFLDCSGSDSSSFCCALDAYMVITLCSLENDDIHASTDYVVVSPQRMSMN